MELQLTAGNLVADPGGPYTVARATRSWLDGSGSYPASQIKSYVWTFSNPAPKCVAKPAGGRKTGVTPTVVMLCNMKVTLTVSNGSRTASASVMINVRPRKWRTSVRQVSVRVGGGGYKWTGPVIDWVAGVNESACPGVVGNMDAMICPLARHTSWYNRGYQLVQVQDPGGPFDRYWYVQSRGSIFTGGLS